MIGQTVGHYRVTGKLGAGGFGIVYRAQDVNLGRPVALKLLQPRAAASRKAEDRFVREARAMASVSHPNVVTIHEIRRIGKRLCIVTEFVDGETLEARLARRPLSPPELLDLASPLLDALAALHDRGILHRDIKPANVMITREGVVKLMDFGIATGSNLEKVTRTGSVSGTFGYMSPEQLRGRPTDCRSDLFSTAAVFYECLTGSPPFPGESPTDCIAATLTREPDPIRDRVPAVPPSLERAILRSLDKKPSRRHQGAREMARDLERAEGVPPLPTAGLPSGARGGGGRPLRGVAAGLAGAALVVVLAILAAMGAFSPPKELSLAVRIFRIDPGGSRLELPDMGEVRAGDHLRVEIEGSRPYHLYILYKDSSGSWYRIFPDDARYPLRNPLPGGTTVKIPPSLALRVDDRPGIEKFWFLATPDPFRGAEEEMAHLPTLPDGEQGAGGGIDEETFARIENAVRTRGLTVAPPPIPPGGARPVASIGQETPAFLRAVEQSRRTIAGRAGVSILRLLDHR